MVCPRCKNEVRTELEKLGLSRSFINIGQIRIHNGVSAIQIEQLKAALIRSGFEPVDRQKGILVRKLNLDGLLSRIKSDSGQITPSTPRRSAAAH